MLTRRTIVKDGDGIYDADIRDKKTWYLAHARGEYVAHGFHQGQVTSRRAVIDLYDTERELIDHAAELGVEIPVDKEIGT